MTVPEGHNLRDILHCNLSPEMECQFYNPTCDWVLGHAGTSNASTVQPVVDTERSVFYR